MDNWPHVLNKKKFWEMANTLFERHIKTGEINIAPRKGAKKAAFLAYLLGLAHGCFESGRIGLELKGLIEGYVETESEKHGKEMKSGRLSK